MRYYYYNWKTKERVDEEEAFSKAYWGVIHTDLDKICFYDYCESHNQTYDEMLSLLRENNEYIDRNEFVEWFFSTGEWDKKEYTKNEDSE